MTDLFDAGRGSGRERSAGGKRPARHAAPRHMAPAKAGAGARVPLAARTAPARKVGASHARTARGRRLGLPALIACAFVLALAVAGGVFAWYTHQVSRENTFQAANLVPTVEEGFDKTTKSNVTVKANDASTPAYIRAQVAVGWVSADGSAAIFGVPEAGADYAMTWGSAVHERGAATEGQLAAGCWVKGADGFYYWSLPLAAGASTGQLIDTCTWKGAGGAADGRKLSVDISAQAIQADTDPKGKAFDDAWKKTSGLTVGDDGVLKVVQ